MCIKVTSLKKINKINKINNINKIQVNTVTIVTSTTKVILEVQWGICPAACVLRQCTVVFARKCRFSVSVGMCHAAYVIFIMWNSISGLDTWYHFRFNISCGVAVKVRCHQEKFQVIF